MRSPYLSSRIKNQPPVDPAHALKLLLPVADQWKSIGMLLGISDGTLAIISYGQQGTISCLQKMLSTWSNKVDPPPTWRDLASAVSPFNPSLAEKLRNLEFSSAHAPMLY